MNYTEYRKIMGFEPASYPSDVTLIDIGFGGGPNEGGMATILLKNDIPLMVKWYEWSPSNLTKRLNQELRGVVELCGTESLGNGHFKAIIRLNGKLHPLLEKA